MAALDVLKKAKGIISDPDHWGKYKFHKIEGGIDRYCAIGALQAAAFGQCGSYVGAQALLGECAYGLAAEKGILSTTGQAQIDEDNPVNPLTVGFERKVDAEPQAHVPNFNDHAEVTHDDVMAAFDCAIAKAEKVTVTEVAS